MNTQEMETRRGQKHRRLQVPSGATAREPRPIKQKRTASSKFANFEICFEHHISKIVDDLP
jgi:hypothetical protein